MNFSLRRAAFLWMTVLLTAVGLITIVIAYWYARTEAAEFLDGQLRQIALNAGVGVPSANAPEATDRDPEDEFAITIWDRSGQIVHRSIPSVTLPRQQQAGFANIEVDGNMWRVYTTISGDSTVQVGQRDTVRAEIADGAALGAAAPIIIVIPLSWLVVGLVMDRALRPLRKLADDLAARSVSAREPISLAAVPAEVAPLVESMNGLIVRLREAIQIQKRFVADAAHELRTPLAAMQINVDNLCGAAPEERLDRAAALRVSVQRASALVDQLLRLARLDEPSPAQGQSIDLSALVLDCVSECAPMADQRDVDLGADVNLAAYCVGVESEVRALLKNLIDNAVRYTPAGGKVDISLNCRAGEFIIEIVDTGIGVPPGSEERIFERFYRAAPHETEGTGLGLAIGRRVAERHGFTLTVENRKDGARGVVARLRVPATT